MTIGMSTISNFVYNYIWYMITKPGCPHDLIQKYQLRKEFKNLESRDAAKVKFDDRVESARDIN